MNSQIKDVYCKIRLEMLVYLFLVSAILAVYWQVGNFEFTLYDDGDYVYKNNYIKDGLTFNNIIWSFTSTYAANWHPLTWISHMADISMYGLNPGQHHLINVIFHIFNTLLLFYIFHQMTGKLWQSGFVAALFALHPLHVESVAWIAERKDILCAFFGMLTIISYIRYVKQSDLKFYLLALLFFSAGLMAKPMLVTLPFILLLLDYWPLNRFAFIPSNVTISIQGKFRSPLGLRLIQEKLLFILLSTSSSCITIYAQQSGGAVASLDSITMDVRIANAIVSYVNYIGKMLWPCCLSVFYPHPGLSPLWQVTSGCLFLATMFFLIFRYGRKYPYLAVGWLWFVGTLIPVIGLVQVGSQRMADRYTYMPLIGLFIIIAWGIPDLLRQLAHLKITLTMLVILTLSACMFATWIQVSYWRNDITLFQHALDVTDNNYIAHNNLGLALARQGQLDQAKHHYYESLRIEPSHKRAHNNLGIVLSVENNQNEAIKHFKAAIKADPDYEAALNNLGFVLYNQGKLKEAITYYSLALNKDHTFIVAHNNLVKALIQQGKIKEAMDQYIEILHLNSNDTVARSNLDLLINKRNADIKTVKKSLRIPETD